MDQHSDSPHDSARQSPETLDGFHSLVRDINSILGPSNGINSEGIDVNELKKAMAQYHSNEEEGRDMLSLTTAAHIPEI
ncbi:hypothetical protein MRB53_038391 [Persea americana]|nr:hypothetical protein MRB53_038391 [Persea americana]